MATRADIPAVDELLARSYPRLLKPDYAPSVLVLAIPLIAKANAALVTCGTYYVAEDDRARVIGAGGWTRRAPPGGGEAPGLGHVRHMGTDPDAVRRGVGRVLMERIVRDATAAGLSHLEAKSTLTAVPFYAAMGFAELERIEVELRPCVVLQAVRMLRRLR